MLAAIGLFTAGSVMCALAGNILVLNLGRALQGIGGGGIMPLAQIIIADAITPRERGRYQAYIGVIWIGAGIAGPTLGGLIAGHLHWSLIFWLNVPLGITGAGMSYAVLKRLPRHDRKHRLDLMGAALIVASAVTLLLALTWGGTRYPWLSGEIALLLAVSSVFALMFVSATDPHGGAFSAAADPRKPGGRGGNAGQFMRGRRVDSTDRLSATVFPARARAVGERLGAGSHSPRGNVHTGLHHGGPSAVADAALQAVTDRGGRRRDRRHRGGGLVAGGTIVARDHGADDRQLRHAAAPIRSRPCASRTPCPSTKSAP